MRIFVYGEDSFRVQEKVKWLKDGFVKKYDPTGFNVSAFPAGDAPVDPGEVLQSACSLPFLGEKRMVIVRDVLTNAKKDDESVWLAGMKRVPDSTIVIFWESADVKAFEKKALVKKLPGETHAYPFPELGGTELQKWTADRIKSRGSSIAPDALRSLVERVRGDLWQMNGETEKLVAFAGGQTITAKMVNDLVRASFEGQIFAFVDAVSHKQTAKALKMLQEERLAGTKDFYLMAMLTRQVRILLGCRSMLDQNPRVSSQEVAQELGQNPYSISKALPQARQFTFADLKAVHDLLFTFDAGTKSGRISAELAVDLVMVELMK